MKANGSATDEWRRLRSMRHAGDTKGLIKELEDSRNSTGETASRRQAEIRDQAVWELAKLKDPVAVTPVAKLLADPLPLIRADAAIALGKLNDRRAVPALVNALRDEDKDVRGCAARSLGWLGDRSAVAPLAAALSDDNPWIRLASAKALARLADAQAIGPLREAVRQESFRHPTFRLRLARSLLLLRIRSLGQR